MGKVYLGMLNMRVGGTMTRCSGGTVVLLRSFLSLTHLKAALDALVGSNPEEEEVGMDLDPDLVYWCNIRLVNSWY